MGDPLEIELPRETGAAWHARRWLEAQYEAKVEAEYLETAKLLASELVNNAVVHGQGMITLRATHDENRLLIEVLDEGSGFERLIEEHSFEKVGGRGLEIVEAGSSRWGVHEGTTHVWFELERPGPRVGAGSKPPLDESD